jgi:hypothetical protein
MILDDAVMVKYKLDRHFQEDNPEGIDSLQRGVARNELPWVKNKKTKP